MFLCWLRVYLILCTVSASFPNTFRGLIYHYRALLLKMEGRFESVSAFGGEEETLIGSTLRIIGKDRLLNGTISFLADIDDTNGGAIDIYSFKNGEWIQSHIKVRTTPCEMITNYVRKYCMLPNADTDLPVAGKNCIKKGDYYVKNLQPSSENWPTFLPRGLVKFVMFYTTFKGKRIGGIEFIFYAHI